MHTGGKKSSYLTFILILLRLNVLGGWRKIQKRIGRRTSECVEKGKRTWLSLEWMGLFSCSMTITISEIRLRLIPRINFFEIFGRREDSKNKGKMSSDDLERKRQLQMMQQQLLQNMLQAQFNKTAEACFARCVPKYFVFFHTKLWTSSTHIRIFSFLLVSLQQSCE